MKKLILLIALLPILFSSCTKDEESIKGTMWSVTMNGNYRTIIFDADSCTYTFNYANRAYTSKYPYTLNYPVVNMQGDSFSADLRGSIDGNTMVVTNMSTHETLGVFIKNY